MSKLRVLDLFSGIGGFSLGLERTGGFETVAFCEIEPFPRRVLAKHWPQVPCYDDVRTLTAARLAADGIGIDVITGGFPCQPFSTASRGRRVAVDLWGEMLRLGRELRPEYIVAENVPGLGDVGIDRVCTGLEDADYTVWRTIWTPRRHPGTAAVAASSSWPTPTAKANHDAPSMRKWPAYASYQSAVSRTFPPLWEWMMGYPIGWTGLAALETPSPRRSLKELGEPYSTAEGCPHDRLPS